MAAFFSRRYSFSTGYHSKVPAQRVGEVLDSIRERGEEATAKSFLDASRDESSPTHEMFEWNNSIAAEKYRLSQAATIICHLELTIEEYETEEVTLKLEEEPTEDPINKMYFKSGFVNVNQRTARSATAVYVPTDIALSDKEMRKAVLRNALDSLKAFERSYAHLKEMAKVIAAIHEVEEEIDIEE